MLGTPRPITFLSDYGSDDEFAGVCRAVIARIAPDVTVIDLSHGVARYDVEQGAAMLANALPYSPPGIHLAVVDPGVGTQRRAVAVKVAGEDRILVGPDNGLLAPAIERLGGPVEAAELSRSPVRLEPVSATFHGRDIFAPVAAHLALGMSLPSVGAELDPAELIRLDRPAAHAEPGRLSAAVGRIDGFGNATLLADAGAAAQAGIELGSELIVEAGGATHDARFALTFGEVNEGELILYVNSTNGLTLAVNQGSAGERLAISSGDRIALTSA